MPRGQSRQNFEAFAFYEFERKLSQEQRLSIISEDINRFVRINYYGNKADTKRVNCNSDLGHIGNNVAPTHLPWVCYNFILLKRKHTPISGLDKSDVIYYELRLWNMTVEQESIPDEKRFQSDMDESILVPVKAYARKFQDRNNAKEDKLTVMAIGTCIVNEPVTAKFAGHVSIIDFFLANVPTDVDPVRIPKTSQETQVNRCFLAFIIKNIFKENKYDCDFDCLRLTFYQVWEHMYQLQNSTSNLTQNNNNSTQMNDTTRHTLFSVMGGNDDMIKTNSTAFNEPSNIGLDAILSTPLNSNINISRSIDSMVSNIGSIDEEKDAGSTFVSRRSDVNQNNSSQDLQTIYETTEWSMRNSKGAISTKQESITEHSDPITNVIKSKMIDRKAAVDALHSLTAPGFQCSHPSSLLEDTTGFNASRAPSPNPLLSPSLAQSTAPSGNVASPHSRQNTLNIDHQAGGFNQQQSTVDPVELLESLYLFASNVSKKAMTSAFSTGISSWGRTDRKAAIASEYKETLKKLYKKLKTEEKKQARRSNLVYPTSNETSQISLSFYREKDLIHTLPILIDGLMRITFLIRGKQSSVTVSNDIITTSTKNLVLRDGIISDKQYYFFEKQCITESYQYHELNDRYDFNFKGHVDFVRKLRQSVKNYYQEQRVRIDSIIDNEICRRVKEQLFADESIRETLHTETVKKMYYQKARENLYLFTQIHSDKDGRLLEYRYQIPSILTK